MLSKFFKLIIISLVLTLTACGASEDNNPDKTNLGYAKNYVIGQNFEDVINLFKVAHFDNIQVIRLESEEFQNLNHGQVVDVKIGDLDDFDADTVVDRNEKVVISYIASDENYTLLSTTDSKNVDSLELFKASDYLLFNDNNDLGWDETWTITVKAEPNDLIWSDFEYQYDPEILNVKATQISYDDKYSYLEFEVNSVAAGLTEVKVCANGGEEPKYFEFSVNCLDEVEGRRVYIVPNQDEYHYTEECPDENAIMTTYHFAASKNIKACPKCVNTSKDEINNTNQE